MKCDERTAAIASRELRAEIDRQIVGSPVSGERRYRRYTVRADANGLSTVATVFRGQDQFFLPIVIVALRPSIVCALRHQDQLFRRKSCALFSRIKLRPVL